MDTGSLSVKDSLKATRPSWLALNREQTRLYFVEEAEEIGGVYGGAVGSVDISGLYFKNPTEIKIGASGPTHICVADRHLFLACYREGALAEVGRFDECLLAEVRLFRHKGNSINPTRQNQPHPHFSLLTPDGKYLAVCDLGLDRIFLYPYGKERGIAGEPKQYIAPLGSGPRHALFSSDGEYLYVVTEMGASVLVYSYFDGVLTLLQEISVLAEEENKGQCGAIRLNHAGNELFVTERVSNRIVFFSVGNDGRLSRRGFIPTAPHPRDAVFSPDGRWLLSANQRADKIDIYSYSDDLSLPLGERVKLEHSLPLGEGYAPSCIAFVTANPNG